jgi:Co/Zn/Cd efflux system component
VTSHDNQRLLSQDNEIHPSYGTRNSDHSDSEPDVQVKDGHRDNISVKVAFIHVVGDLIQSIGVLVAAFIIYFKVSRMTFTGRYSSISYTSTL